MCANQPTDADVFKEPEIRAQLNIEDLVWRQIDRTNISASYDENTFAANVRVLMSMLPSHKRTELIDRREDYVYDTEQWSYKYFCGVPMGTPENPVAGSPFLMKSEEVDWQELYELILSAFEECNISWKIERETIALGKVDKSKSSEPTPYFGPPTDTPEE